MASPARSSRRHQVVGDPLHVYPASRIGARGLLVSSGQMRNASTACAVLAALSLTGCAGGHSHVGDHSVADVSAALHAVGLNGFRPISTAEILREKQTRGVSADQFVGGFSFVRIGHGPQQHPPVVAISIAIATDRSVIDKVEKEAKKTESQRLPVRVHLARAGNVLILSVSEQPDAADRSILERIPKLIAYLDKQQHA